VPPAEPEDELLDTEMAGVLRLELVVPLQVDGQGDVERDGDPLPGVQRETSGSRRLWRRASLG
jgi:hypothetical protein